jgi:hypothetical protein
MINSEELLACQTADGGWSYGRGASWTEPTCYALLALAAAHSGSPAAIARGVRWLAERQRPDGGWAPRDRVDQSTWVTALVLLLPAGLTRGLDRDRAGVWLLGQTGRESGFVQRLRMRLLGARLYGSQAFDGWPWFPGAAAWVTPTALSILALEKMYRSKPDESIRARIAEGRSFLFACRCQDGGWNHGSTRALGYESDSYPETTGTALLALHGSTAPEMSSAIAAAERHLSGCKSREASRWLSLALLASGRKPEPAELPARGGTVEMALDGLTEAARQGRNLFLE